MDSVSNIPVQIPTRSVLGLNISVTRYEDTIQRSVRWAQDREPRALFFANVHVVMEAYDNGDFRESLNRADIVAPDGVPLVWALRALGERSATRVYGPDAMVAMLNSAEQNELLVGFYGGSESVLYQLLSAVRARHPRLKVAFSYSPPFRPMSPGEDANIVEQITASKAQILFVGLGCPKQEVWIMDHLNHIPAVMFGVGAAFDFLGGNKPQAPRWMMRLGLEWLFRLASEPRRLGRRYLKHNPRFVGLFLWQLARSQLSPGNVR